MVVTGVAVGVGVGVGLPVVGAILYAVKKGHMSRTTVTPPQLRTIISQSEGGDIVEKEQLVKLVRTRGPQMRRLTNRQITNAIFLRG